MYVSCSEGIPILLLRQAEDFVIATPDPNIAAFIYDAIGKALQLHGKESPPFKQLGLVASFNGIDIL
jgi:hypothetical protein